MRRALRLYRVFVTQSLKGLVEYKIDFLTGAFSFFINQTINIAFLYLIFAQIPDLIGWSFEQIVFIYGFSLLPKGLDHLLADNLWKVGYYIVNQGHFDKYLTRPVNTLFHVMFENFEIDALGELILGFALLLSTAGGIGVSLTILDSILLLIVISFAASIYTSIKIIFASIAFKTKRSGHIIHVFYMVNDFAKYPTTIYNNLIRTIITYIIPFAFTAFYPASYFITRRNPVFHLGGTIIIATCLMIFAIFIWHKMLKTYESAGS